MEYILSSPWFANTQLLTTRISANELDEQIKSTTGKGNPLQMRILEVPEVCVTKLFSQGEF